MVRVIERSELRAITLGHPLVDAYLEFVGGRGAVNTWLATPYDLKVFFEVIGGIALADPFYPTEELVGLLRARAAELGA
jgi:uncharacterized membrane protein